MFILNAPSWFNVLWKVIAPLLHENTRKKINILGRDHKAVLEAIDARFVYDEGRRQWILIEEEAEEEEEEEEEEEGEEEEEEEEEEEGARK
eukprot:evm.model.NODE_23569_length_22012_cov_24.440624.6